MRGQDVPAGTHLPSVAPPRALRAILRDPFGARAEGARRAVYVVLLAIILEVTAQRSLFPYHPHPTFPIFRESFWHLIGRQDLYALYDQPDRFKYSPTAALLFAPFAIPPFALGLLLWNTCNVAALVSAFDRLFSRRDATFALLLVVPEIHAAMLRSQSNSLVAALIILSFLALEHERQLGGYLAIAVGAAIKLFPLAALSFALFHPRRVRAALLFAAGAIALLLLPLLVTPATALLAQYKWWYAIESVDAHARGTSVMLLLHDALRVSWPNWPVQLFGVLALLLPLTRRDRWPDPSFRLGYLASLLVFVVIFNHQAERPSFIIASAGAAIWFVSSAREPWRLALVLLSLTGIYALGFLPIWAIMQIELIGFGFGPDHAYRKVRKADGDTDQRARGSGTEGYFPS